MSARLTFSGPVFHWRGPAPFHFVRVPPDETDLIAALAPVVTYGWGMIPVVARIGATEWTTSLWPKDGGYLVPIRTAVRHAEDIELDDVVELVLDIVGS